MPPGWGHLCGWALVWCPELQCDKPQRRKETLSPHFYQAAQTEGLSKRRDCWGSLCFACKSCRTAPIALSAWEQVSTGPDCSSHSSTPNNILLAKIHYFHRDFNSKKYIYLYIWQKSTPSSMCVISKLFFLITQFRTSCFKARYTDTTKDIFSPGFLFFSWLLPIVLQPAIKAETFLNRTRTKYLSVQKVPLLQ